MVTLNQLLARTELALDLVVDSPSAGDRNVTIVHSSELPEVDEWLAGGEVLLTIGVGRDLGADTVADYLARLKRVGVHALGVGLGSDLPWQEIPESLIAHAEAVGIGLFGVPEPVPFVAVVDAFTRMREEETNRELHRASTAGRRFATTLTRQGPSALVDDLAETLGAPVLFVSPTGRSLTGGDGAAGAAGDWLTGVARAQVRRELIAESLKASTAPRLIRTAAAERTDIVEAVPVGDEEVRGWILTPAEGSGSSRTRSLLLSTAASLLGLSFSEQAPQREESALFTTPMSVAEARAEWVVRTGLAPVSRAHLRIFSAVRGELAETLMSDLSPGVLPARAGSMLAVIGTGADSDEELIDRVAKITGVKELAEKTLPLTQIHHAWSLWRTQHEAPDSDVRALLSAIDEAAARRFADRVLGGLLGAKDAPMLLETLRAFVSAGGVRDAVAAELGIHRHTVRARMTKIEALLGRDLSRAEEAQAVAIALELAEH
ncbi:PucR family transcriptional regulator [Brevibacterium sp. GP-SGM9]|uniref:PucR family transcriptional regulator n=1 Tax=Brevibacterium sp. GP-SGM9 TaxID=3376990 RepID=UPI0039A61DC9